MKMCPYSGVFHLWLSFDYFRDRHLSYIVVWHMEAATRNRLQYCLYHWCIWCSFWIAVYSTHHHCRFDGSCMVPMCTKGLGSVQHYQVTLSRWCRMSNTFVRLYGYPHSLVWFSYMKTIWSFKKIFFNTYHYFLLFADTTGWIKFPWKNVFSLPHGWG